MVHCRTGNLVVADADNVSFFYTRSIFFVVFRKEWMRDERPILEMKGITKTFGSVTANENVDLTLYPGEIHALLGENGAGKSTLMNVLNGIYRPNSGEILHKGKKVMIRSPKHAVDMGIGMVHQHFRLIPTLTAAENVFLYMPKCNLVLKKKEMEEQIRKWSEEFHLEVEPSALIWQLSVGEQQRVEIVKLLSRGAEILILDEPSAVLTAPGSQRKCSGCCAVWQTAARAWS